jgi:hypothetical protein
MVPTAVAARIKSAQASQAPGAAQFAAGQAATAQAGWLVLTTFEEVQTTAPLADVQGDAVLSQTHSGANRGGDSSTSLTITRLVFRVAPASRPQPASSYPPRLSSQPGNTAQPDSPAPLPSNSAQPIAIPYRDGWLVIQL